MREKETVNGIQVKNLMTLMEIINGMIMLSRWK